MRISESTLSSWRTRLRKTPDWRPSRRAYALPRRIFTGDQEDQLVTRIKTRYLEDNLFYCDEDLKLDALHFYEEIRSELEERALDDPEAEKRLQTMPLSKASAPFILGFRYRNRLTLRRPLLKPRCHINELKVNTVILIRITKHVGALFLRYTQYG
jgi:hypothetical protein